MLLSWDKTHGGLDAVNVFKRKQRFREQEYVHEGWGQPQSNNQLAVLASGVSSGVTVSKVVLTSRTIIGTRINLTLYSIKFSAKVSD